jgi:hypothetical protein
MSITRENLYTMVKLAAAINAWEGARGVLPVHPTQLIKSDAERYGQIIPGLAPPKLNVGDTAWPGNTGKSFSAKYTPKPEPTPWNSPLAENAPFAITADKQARMNRPKLLARTEYGAAKTRSDPTLQSENRKMFNGTTPYLRALSR